MKRMLYFSLGILLLSTSLYAAEVTEAGEEEGFDPTAMTQSQQRKRANSKDHSETTYKRDYPGVPSIDTFPMQALDKSAQPSKQPVATLNAPHDLALSIEKNGHAWASVAGQAYAQESQYASGFLIRDVKANGAMTPVALAPTAGDSIMQEGELPDVQLRLKATYAVSGEGIQVSGEIEDLSKQDRAISLYYAIPMHNKSLVWWEDQRTPHRITAMADYLTSKPLDAGAIGAHSFYPMCAINGPDRGLALAIPLDRPVLYRLAYSPSTQMAYVAFDFALTQDTKKFPGKAQFAFNIMAVDPAWGFRSALERYYATYPQFFTKNAKQEGIWTYNDQSKLERPQDFGVMYHEINGVKAYLDKQIALDDEYGIYSLLYTSPEPYNVDFKDNDKRTYEVLMQRWEQDKTGSGIKNQRARVHEATGIKNEDGTYWHQFVKRSWVSGGRMAQNPDPELPKDQEGLNRAVVNYPAEISDMFSDGELGKPGKGLDGIYLDSIGLFTNRLNFRRDHFAYADYPLTFASNTKTPCLILEWSVAEYCKYLADDLHKRGKMLMGNYYPKTFPFLMPYIDLPGTEGSWRSTDLEMNYWRAMSYQKPYLILAHPDASTLTADKIERDFRYALFYGIYPSYFKGVHKEGKKKTEIEYFNEPEYYNVGRPVFQKYVPLIRQLNTAGWQPVTLARSNDPQIWIERYGSAEKGNLFLSVMNASKQSKKVTIELENGLALKTSKVKAKELVTDAPLQIEGNTITLALDKNDVAVLEIQRNS